MQYGKVKGLFLLRKIKSVRAAGGGEKMLDKYFSLL
jgi:hypothetical protein